MYLVIHRTAGGVLIVAAECTTEEAAKTVAAIKANRNPNVTFHIVRSTHEYVGTIEVKEKKLA